MVWKTPRKHSGNNRLRTPWLRRKLNSFKYRSRLNSRKLFKSKRPKNARKSLKKNKNVSKKKTQKQICMTWIIWAQSMKPRKQSSSKQKTLQTKWKRLSLTL
jgi:hypothetical protein